MRRAAVVIACAAGLALGGCGGKPERGPEETIDAWIAAIDAGDYARACELSVWPEDNPGSCEELLREGMRDDTPIDRENMEVEEHDGEYLVHFEIQVIR